MDSHQESNLVHFSLKMRRLVALILMILLIVDWPNFVCLLVDPGFLSPPPLNFCKAHTLSTHRMDAPDRHNEHRDKRKRLFVGLCLRWSLTLWKETILETSVVLEGQSHGFGLRVVGHLFDEWSGSGHKTWSLFFSFDLQHKSAVRQLFLHAKLHALRWPAYETFEAFSGKWFQCLLFVTRKTYDSCSVSRILRGNVPTIIRRRALNAKNGWSVCN